MPAVSGGTRRSGRRSLSNNLLISKCRGNLRRRVSVRNVSSQSYAAVTSGSLSSSVRKRSSRIVLRSCSGVCYTAFDLEKKIELELRIREAAVSIIRTLPHDKLSQPIVEAVKNVLVSELRMKSYQDELEQRQSKNCPAAAIRREDNDGDAGPSRITLSDLRLPLIWNQRDHFKNTGDSRKYAMFCIARIGSAICDTQLMYGVDRSWTDASTSNACIFDSIPPDFMLTIEVYSMLLEGDPFFTTATPGGSVRVRRKLRGSLPRSLGQKLGLSIKKEIEEPPNIQQQFECVARVTLTLEDIANACNVGCYDLHMISSCSHYCKPPLYGHVCCKTSVLPLSSQRPLYEGWLSILLQDSRSASKGYYCVLQSAKLCCWSGISDSSNGADPVLVIPFSSETTVEDMSASSSKIVGGSHLASSFAQGISPCASVVLTYSTSDGASKWKRAFRRQIADCQVWHVSAEEDSCSKQRSPCQNTSFQSPYSLRSGRSLYDAIQTTNLGSSCTAQSSTDLRDGSQFDQRGGQLEDEALKTLSENNFSSSPAAYHNTTCSPVDVLAAQGQPSNSYLAAINNCHGSQISSRAGSRLMASLFSVNPLKSVNSSRSSKSRKSLPGISITDMA